jgi:hypothetical protein
MCVTAGTSLNHIAGILSRRADGAHVRQPIEKSHSLALGQTQAWLISLVLGKTAVKSSP